MVITSNQRDKKMRGISDIKKDIAREVVKALQATTYGDRIQTYGDSYAGPEQHQEDRDTMFMDRDMFILHKDLQKIIKLLENKK